MPFAKVVQELEEEGFGVKVADGGIIASLQGRRPSQQELVGAVSDLEGVPMKTVGGGVYIRVGEGEFF